MMGISERHLQSILQRGRREGWLRFSDPVDQLEFEVIPKVVENLSYWLDQRDKQVTIETAKGTIFKQFAEAKGLNEQPSTVLALKIENPSGEVRAVAGTIVGRPKQRPTEEEPLDAVE